LDGKGGRSRLAGLGPALFLSLALLAYLPAGLDKTQVKWAACFLAAGLAALCVAPPRGGYRLRLVHLFALAWLLAAAASLSFAASPLLAVAGLAREAGLVLSFIALSAVPAAAVPRALALFLAAAAVCASVGIVEKTAGVAPQGLTQQPNVYGAVCAAALPAGLGLVLYGRQCGLPRNRLLLLIPAAALCLAGLAVSRSRGAWLGLLVGAAALAPLLARASGRPALRRLLAASGAVVLLLALAVWLFRDSILSDIRIPIWQSTARVVARAPLGVGLGNFLSAVAPLRVEGYHLHPKTVPLLLHPHSEALRVLAETGWLGLAAWAGVFAALLLRPPRAGNRALATLQACVLASVAALLTHGQLDVILSHPVGALLLWGLAAAAVALGGDEEGIAVGGVALPPWALRAAGVVLVILAVAFAVFPVRSSLLAGGAVRARSEGNWARAAVLYGRAWDADLSNLEAARRFGYALIMAGRLEEAADAYKALLEVAPDYGRVHGELGLLLLMLGHADEAEVHLRRQVELTPQDEVCRRLLDSLGS